MNSKSKLFSFNDAFNLESKDIRKLYKEYSNIKLPDIYYKFSFGKKYFQVRKVHLCMIKIKKNILILLEV